MKKIKKIVVICTANVCRSPMAEGFLKKYLTPQEGFEIISAGIAGEEGFTPSEAATAAMEEEGIDISCYKSKPATRELLESSDIILVMTESHKAYLSDSFPEIAEKIQLYKEFAGLKKEAPDVADPIGQPVSFYRAVKEEIKRATLEIVNRIKKESQL